MNRFVHAVRAVLPSLLVAVLWTAPLTAQDLSQVQIQTVPVAEGVYMLMGSGGNIGVFVGEDGVFVIDDEFAPLTDKILAAIRAVSSEPIRFLLNTHWHGDHTGGNENMHAAGALIVAHHNVRNRLEMDQVLERVTGTVTTPAAPAGALPVLTFGEDMTFHLNGEEVHAFHVQRAHTDGDVVVHFRGTDVVHTGDVFFSPGSGTYPLIDTGSGGSIDGMIAAVGEALAVMDADTRVLPGHGPLSDREGLREYGDMLRTVRQRVANAKRQGRSLTEVQAMRPTREWDGQREGGFVSAAAFVAAIYVSLPAMP